MMRWMLGILLVANVSLFIWGKTAGNRGSVGTRTPLENIGAIELVVDAGESVQVETSMAEVTVVADEPEAMPAPDPAPVEPASNAEPVVLESEVVEPLLPLDLPVKVCGESGPVAEESLAIALQSDLQAQGIDVKVEKQEQSRETGYWALMPAAADSAAAKQTEEKLKAAGISEIWRFRKGDLKDAISLGMYDRKASAENRVKKINAKGFSAEVVPKIKLITEFRIAFQGETLEEATNLIKKAAPELEIKEISCDQDFPF